MAEAGFDLMGKKKSAREIKGTQSWFLIFVNFD